MVGTGLRISVDKWEKIVAIAAGSGYTVGLKADGTAITSGYSSGLDNVSSWNNIVSIAAGSGHTVGLRSDGTVVAEDRGPENAVRVL